MREREIPNFLVVRSTVHIENSILLQTHLKFRCEGGQESRARGEVPRMLQRSRSLRGPHQGTYLYNNLILSCFINSTYVYLKYREHEF